MMGLPVNKILIVAFVSYIAYEVYGLYSYCQPPLDPKGVSWDLRESAPVDILLFLSTASDAPPLDVERSAQHVLVGTFAAVAPAEAASAADVKAEKLELPKAFFRNGTIFLHAFARSGKSVLRHEWLKVSRFVLQKERKVATRYLLSEAEGAQEPGRPVSSLPKVVEVGFVQELRTLSLQGLQGKGFGGFVRGGKIVLPLYLNTLISPRDEYSPLMESEEPGMELRLRNVGMAYWTMQHQISLSFDEAEKTMGLNEYDVDSFKQMIGGSTPLKICLVYSVTILHLVFDYLTFSSDIDFWRRKASFEGLSSSSVALQAAMNVIMFLYVREQQQTKFVMYFIGFRFCLNLWKLRKLTALRLTKQLPFVAWVNRPGATGSLEELEDVTAAERKCMFWLMAVLAPLIVAFSVYRLVTQKFRSWYSWVILSLAISSQIGGFVVMTPQVFMNYRLKSVEHLPWRALTFQAVNTFIDDVFALCIRMPEIQKYSVFRDDIVFAICCFQRWLYRKPKEAAKDE